jgi:transposase-like protein
LLARALTEPYIALVVLWRLRYKLSLRDLPEMFLVRGIVFSHEGFPTGKPGSRRHWPKVYGDTDAAK